MDHSIAYERRQYSSSVLPYRPLVLRDLWCVVRDALSCCTPPFTFKRLSNAGIILLFAPLFLPLVGFHVARSAALEKYEWDWLHSRATVTLLANSGTARRPSWHAFAAWAVGLFWGAVFFLIGFVPYIILPTVTQ